MNTTSWLLWGFTATLIMSILLALSQIFRLTRINLPLIMGLMVTADRDAANAIGFLFYMITGMTVSLLYVAIFESLNLSNVLIGMAAGLVHGLFVVTIVMSLLPGIHPRMASEHQTPFQICRIEPPGILGTHYGIMTPVISILSHIVFGAILGAFYQLQP
jgi:hypothetical protein